jgi:hypothetical protein
VWVSGVYCIILISALDTERFDRKELNMPVFHPQKDVKKMADILEEHLLT